MAVRVAGAGPSLHEGETDGSNREGGRKLSTGEELFQKLGTRNMFPICRPVAGMGHGCPTRFMGEL